MSTKRDVVAVELDGKLHRVIGQSYRMELQIAWCWDGLWRAPWDLELQDGRTITVYHDLTSGGWFEVTDLPTEASYARAVASLAAYERERAAAAMISAVGK